MSLPIGPVEQTCRDYERLREWGKERDTKGVFRNNVHVMGDLKIPPVIYG